MFCPRTIPIALVFLVLITASPSYAEDVNKAATGTIGHLNLRPSQPLFAVSQNQPAIRQYLATAKLSFGDVYSNRALARAHQVPDAGRKRSTGRKILGGILGGVGGFFGGGYLGAAIEGDRCNCDDPGLMGFLIGAPVGATVGAILGVKFF